MIERQIAVHCFLRDLRGDSIVTIPLPNDGNTNPLFRVTIADGEHVHSIYRFVSGFGIRFEDDNYILSFTTLRLRGEYYFPQDRNEILLDPVSVEEWVRNQSIISQQVPMEIER